MIKKQYILLVIVVLSFFSCDKKLDIAPENTLVDAAVFKTESGTEQALSEVYYNFLKAVTNGFSYTYGDFTTSLLRTTPAYNNYINGEATPSDYYVVSTWSLYFAALNSANNVIEKVPLFANYDPAKQQQFIAEAKFVRAYIFLNLLCLYGDEALSGNDAGLGLPLQITPFEGYNTGEVIARSTNREVFEQIINDLTESIPDLPDQYPDAVKTRSRATKGAANALLSRVYLYKGDYVRAAEFAKAVLEKSPSLYNLEGNLSTLFPFNPGGTAQSFSTEYVFGFPVSQMVSSSTVMSNNIGGTYFFKRSYWINPAFISEFNARDLRATLLIWKGDSIYNPNMFGEKTTFKFNNSNGRDNVPMIRFAEVMLGRAESLAHIQGVNTESVSLLNSVHQRSVSGDALWQVSDFESPQALLDKILQERKFEFAFEGLNRYDLIRNGIPLTTPDIPENKKTLPIPQSEIDISHGIIKQNSAY